MSPSSPRSDAPSGSGEWLSEYDFPLPESLIAQHPVAPRDHSRLLHVRRSDGTLGHRRFHELDRLLRPGDLLVLNDTRVIPARLIGRKETGGRAEVFLSRPLDADGEWEALLHLSGKARPGLRVRFPLGEVTLVDELQGGLWRIRIEGDDPRGFIESTGRVPLPPYIRREDASPQESDRERYQTVYARESGAVAAPTAGLHFTPELLGRLESLGVETARVTLHVGLGTFAPIKAESIEAVRLHEERFLLPAPAADAIRRAKREGRRVVAVGTTTVRVLETVAREGEIEAREGTTRLFLHPGESFRVVDALISNFHLPRSSLLMLMAAFMGKPLLDRAYALAVRESYRFFSYGDAMLVE